MSIMSEAQIQAFVNVLKSDTALMERLKAAADIDSVVAIAKEAGFADVFTEEEVIKAKADQFKAQDSEQLSDDELDTVAGGGYFNMGNWGWGGCNCGIIPSWCPIG